MTTADWLGTRPSIPEVPVTTRPAGLGSRVRVTIYVTGFHDNWRLLHPQVTVDQALVGRIIATETSAHPTAWVRDRIVGPGGPVAHALLEGALVNPPMLEDHFYRSFHEGTSFLVRYCGTPRMEVIAGPDGKPWHYNRPGYFDGITVSQIVDAGYIEVQGPLFALDSGEVPVPEAQEVAEVIAVPTDNPDLEIGSLYFVGSALAQWTEKGFLVSDVGGPRIMLLSGDTVWKKVELSNLSTRQDEAEYQRRIDVIKARTEDLNDGLIELAKQEGWCTTFDDLAHSIGLRGCREPKDEYRSFNVGVEVTFNFSISSGSELMDCEVVNRVEGMATRRIVFPVQATNADTVAGAITDTMVEDALKEATELSVSDLIDWEVEEFWAAE